MVTTVLQNTTHVSYSIQVGEQYIFLGTEWEKAVALARQYTPNPVIITTKTTYSVTETRIA